MGVLKSGFCAYCEKQVACQKQCNNFLHLVLSFLTGGFWLIIYIPILLFGSHRCPFCGKNVIPGTKDPKILEKK